MPKSSIRPVLPERPSGRILEARFTMAATVEQLLLFASLFWALGANRLFFIEALRGRSLADPSTWGFALALLAALVALHVFLLGLVANRWTVKPLLALVILATAMATYFMQNFGVYLGPSMLRNAMRTDVAEARELLSWRLVPHLLLYAALPIALLSRVRIVRRPWLRAAGMRLLVLSLAAVCTAGAVVAVFQPLASLMRNNRELRYLVTPANYLWSLSRVAAAQLQGATAPRLAIGLDAAAGPSWTASRKPRLLVLVVGETARAANWGLSGYTRQTTPQLAALPVVNFSRVSSCGTDTEVSVPCMFAPVGRRHYDESRIRGSESLLHVLARAGVAVHWRDNQSGCKGVCDGLPNDSPAASRSGGPCADGRCLDEVLLDDLDRRLAAARGVQLLVLHTLGNHGPAYFRRYPPAFGRFQPACDSDDLRRCSREQIVNAYDNALLYTDDVLARLVRTLAAHAADVDSAFVYVSDHGESLGENNLYLHGMPYAIAPQVQTRVPMLMWASAGWADTNLLDVACVRRHAGEPYSHDHLFHTLLGLLDVRTALYEPALDIAHPCRGQAAA